MQKIIDLYFTCLKHAIVALLVGMVILVFSNVTLRYVFNSGIIIVDELSRWMLVYMVFLGSIIGLRDYSHLGVDTLVRKASPAIRRVMFVMSHSLMMMCCVFLINGAYKQIKINWSVQSATLPMSMAFFYGIGIVFGASALVILGCQLYNAITGKTFAHELIAVKNSEEHKL